MMRHPACATARSDGPRARVAGREAFHGLAADAARREEGDRVRHRRGDGDDDDAAHRPEQGAGREGRKGARDEQQHEHHVDGAEGDDARPPPGSRPTCGAPRAPARWASSG